MSSQMTLWDSPNATSSPGSEDGPSPPSSQDGQTSVNSGPARRRASRSASRARAKPRLTIGTCGPTFFDSSVPDGPLSSWESRLRRLLAGIGSTECLLTWKASATPAGRPLSRLVPSTRPTEGIACGLWPTPTAQDSEQSGGAGSIARGARGHSLHSMSRALWATPTVHSPGGSPEAFLARKEALNGACGVSLTDLRMQVEAALWPTATVGDARNSRNATANRSPENDRHNSGWTLSDHAHAMALWPTPTHRDHMPAHTPEYIASKKAQGHGMSNLSDIEPLGMVPPGSSATTEKPGALNPAFVCWLMGFPPEWDACAPTATRSSRSSRRK